MNLETYMCCRYCLHITELMHRPHNTNNGKSVHYVNRNLGYLESQGSNFFNFVKLCILLMKVVFHFFMDKTNNIFEFLYIVVFALKSCLTLKEEGGSKMTLWVFDWLPFLTRSCYDHKNS